MEFTIYNKVGGKGTVCLDRLTLTPLPPEDTSPLQAKAITDTAPALEQRLADGKPDTFWLSGAVKQQTVTLDLGKVREFGGAIVQWVPGLQASQYVVRSSSDGRSWRDLRTVTAGAGGTDWLALPDTEARYLRFDLRTAPTGATASKCSCSRWHSPQRRMTSSSRWLHNCRVAVIRAASPASSRTGPSWVWTVVPNRA